MNKILRWVIVILFATLIVIPALFSARQSIDLLLLPWIEVQEWPLVGVAIIFVGYGVLGTVLISLLDRAQLTLNNKQLKKKLALAEKELKELRQIMAGEPEHDA